MDRAKYPANGGKERNTSRKTLGGSYGGSECQICGWMLVGDWKLASVFASYVALLTSQSSYLLNLFEIMREIFQKVSCARYINSPARTSLLMHHDIC